MQALVLRLCRGSLALSLCCHSEGWLCRKLLTVVLCKLCLLMFAIPKHGSVVTW